MSKDPLQKHRQDGWNQVPAGAAGSPRGADPIWSPPSPLTAGSPPPFPIDTAFPPGLAYVRDYIGAVAEELQVPVDLPAMLLPPIGAVCLAQKFEVEVRAGWRQPLAQWTLILLPSGDRKSAGFERMMSPIKEWERDEAERLGPEIAAQRETRLIAEKRLENLRRNAAKGNADPEKIAEAVSQAQKLAAESLIVAPQLTTNEPTTEALGALLEANGERALVASPEGDALDVVLGRYSDRGKAPNFGLWLCGYSGDAYRIDRRGAAPVYLRRPALSVALTAQPEAVRGMFANPLARGRGYIARFWVCAPASRMGHRTIGARPVPEGLAARYHLAIRRLLAARADPDLGPRVIRFGPEALEMITGLERAIEPELARGGALGDRREWAAKLVGGAARLAAVLHGLQVLGEGGSVGSVGCAQQIDADTARAALTWVPYLIDHDRHVAGVLGCDPATTLADRLLGWIERAGLREFTKRDAFASVRSAAVRVVEDVEPALRVLEEHGYLRQRPAPPASEKGGRPPSPVFDVNPLWERKGVGQ